MSMVDAFSSGSGLADKKHFTVDVEHQFTTRPTSLLVQYIFIFSIFFLIFTFPLVRGTVDSVDGSCELDQCGGGGAADAALSG